MSTLGIVKRFRRAEIPARSAALAYHSLVGIVPMMGLILSYLQAIGATKRWLDILMQFFLSHIDMSSSKIFLRYFSTLTTIAQSRTSSVFGVLVLLYTTFNLIQKLGNSLDVIFDTGLETPSMRTSYLKLFVRRLLVIVVLPVFMLLSAVAASWLQKDSWLREAFRMETVGPILAFPIPLAIDMLAIFAIYQFIPRDPGRWTESLRAACIVGPVFVGMKWLVTFYSRDFLISIKLSGAIAALLLFMIWVQLAWSILLSGALLIRRYGPTYSHKRYG